MAARLDRLAQLVTIPKAMAAWLIAWPLVLVSARAMADDAPDRQDTAIERFYLSGTPAGIHSVESATSHPGWSLHAWIGHESNSLISYQPGAFGPDRAASLLSARTAGGIGGSAALTEKLTISIGLPMVMRQQRNSAEVGPLLTTTAIGDVNAAVHLQLRKQARLGYDLALATAVTVPSGSSKGYVGERSVTARAILMISRRNQQVRWAVNAGIALRPRVAVAATEINDEVLAAVGIGYRIDPPVELQASLSLATAVRDPFGDPARNQAEAMVGADVSVSPSLSVNLAAGTGLARGYGSPDWRGVLALRYQFSYGCASPPRPAL